MPHIPLEEHLPGITGLLNYRQDSAAPIRELTQFLLRGPNTLTVGERDLTEDRSSDPQVSSRSAEAPVTEPRCRSALPANL